MKNLGRWTAVLAMALGGLGCGAEAGAPSTSADGGAQASPDAAAPVVSDRCAAACRRIAECSAMSGDAIDEGQCRRACAASAPAPVCFGCFEAGGACASSCGEACAMCFFSRCGGLSAPAPPAPADDVPPAPADAPPAPPPDAATPAACGTGALHAHIGRDCQGDFQCGTDVCNRNVRNALNSYCTQPCNGAADCPCPGSGGDWACELIPGRSAVQRYCVARGR